MYVRVNVKNANPNPLLRNKKAHIIIGSVQYVVYCTYKCDSLYRTRPCKCYAKYTPIKITFYPILTDMKHHLFFGVVGGVYCRSSFEKKMTSQHKRKKKKKTQLQTLNFWEGLCHVSCFKIFFFYVVSGKLREGEAFCQKKNKNKILEGTHPVARLLCPCSKKKLIN